MTETINVTARRIKKGSKTYIEVAGLGASRNAIRFDNSWKRPAAYAVAIEIVNET
jgi:hypothetical protein